MKDYTVILKIRGSKELRRSTYIPRYWVKWNFVNSTLIKNHSSLYNYRYFTLDFKSFVIRLWHFLLQGFKLYFINSKIFMKFISVFYLLCDSFYKLCIISRKFSNCLTIFLPVPSIVYFFMLLVSSTHYELVWVYV